MTLGDLLKIGTTSDVRLHDARTGKLVARTSHKRLEKFKDVEICYISPKIDAKDSFAHGYLFVYGDTYGIEKARETE